MFLRMFGRSKATATGDGIEQGQDICEEKPDNITQEDFVLLENSEGSQQVGFAYDPPPNYSLPGANAFLPDPSVTSNTSATRMSSADSVRSILDGVPFRLSSRVTTGSGIADAGDDCIAQTLARINSFNVDQYDYNFKLEKSILQEFNSQEDPQFE